MNYVMNQGAGRAEEVGREIILRGTVAWNRSTRTIRVIMRILAVHFIYVLAFPS